MDILTPEQQRLLDEAIEEANAQISNESIEDVLNEVEDREEEKLILNENSQTILINETTSRFSDAEWFNKIKEQTVTIGGIGGIGSWTALLLSRTNVGQIVLYDNDVVEEVNLAGQFHSYRNIGNSKVASIGNSIMEYSRFYGIRAINDTLNEFSQVSNICIGGFDNMQARRNMFMAWNVYRNSFNNNEKCLLVDARLNAEEFQVFCMRGTDDYLIEKYNKEWLFSDSEAEQTRCSYKQTSYCANMVASVIVNLVVNFVANMCNPLIDRELPFMTVYDASLMKFKTYNS